MEESSHKNWSQAQSEPYTGYNQQTTVKKDNRADTDNKKSGPLSRLEAREAHAGEYNQQQRHDTGTRTDSDHKGPPFSPPITRAEQHNRQRRFTETTAPDLSYKSQSFSYPEHYIEDTDRQRRLTTTGIPDTDYTEIQQAAALITSDMIHTSQAPSYAQPRAEDHHRQRRPGMSTTSNTSHFPSHVGPSDDQDQQRRFAMPNPSDTSRTALHANPFGYTIMPPDTDTSLPQGNPILDVPEHTYLENFWSDPDRNTAAVPENPAMTTYMNDYNFNIDLDVDTDWSFQHQASNDMSNFTNYGQIVQQPLDNSGNSMQRYATASTGGRHYVNNNHINLAIQPSQNVLSNFGIEEDAPADVLQAATKLFEYTSQRQASVLQPQRPDIPNRATFQQPHESHQAQAFQASMNAPPHTHASSSSHPQLNGHFRTSVDASPAYSPTASTPFPPQRHSFPTAQPMEFGSDRNFNPHGYHSSYQQMNDQQRTEFALPIVPYTDSTIPSAASSHPHSPTANRQDAQYPAQYSFGSSHPTVKHEAGSEAFSSNSKKRRRTMPTAVDNESVRYDNYIEASPNMNNQSSPDGSGASPTANSQSSPDPADDDMPSNSRKRRKSSSAAQAKAGGTSRKNLTEEQKRENHIKSEQKRRNIIKDGYANLNALVPNLKQGGFSKSATLTETVRELETLQEANQDSRLRLMEELGMSAEDLQTLMDKIELPESI